MWHFSQTNISERKCLIWCRLCVPGESGLGKSTLVNSLFLTDLHKDRKLLNAEGEPAVAPNTRQPHRRLQTCCVFLTCRANQSDGGDHQAHGGHRGEGREAEADHRGHPWVRRRCRQQRVVRSHFAWFKIQLWQHFLNLYSGKFKKWETRLALQYYGTCNSTQRDTIYHWCF